MEAVKEAQKQSAKVETVKLLPIGKKEEVATEQQKQVVRAMVEKFAEKTPPTAEQRIERKGLFEAVAERFSFLKSKSNDLKMFDAGNDKINAKIILQNQAGFKFEVSNSTVIKKVRDAMEAELNILLAEAENEVLNFEI